MVKLETKFGGIGVFPLRADCIRVEAGIPHNDENEHGLTINTIEVSVQGFLWLWSDARWHFGREDDRMSQIYEPRLSRRTLNVRDMSRDVSRSAQGKARDEIERVIHEWTGEPEAELEIARAELKHRTNERNRAVQEETAARGKLREAHAKVESANDAMERAAFVLERAGA